MNGTFWRSSIGARALASFALFVVLCAASGRAQEPAAAEKDASEKPAASAKKKALVVSGLKLVTLRADGPQEDGKEADLTGRLLIGREVADERESSGLSQYVMEDALGKLRAFDGSAIESVEELPDLPLDDLREKIGALLLQEFGEGFRITTTEHYIFVSDASEGYVEWCSRLFESLESGFGKYLTKNECDLPERVELMVVVVFSHKKDFVAYASKETPSADRIAAYYNLETNRVVLYDLSEIEQYRSGEERRRRPYQEVKEFLSRPNAAFNVATIVHEATHQIAFNRRFFLRTGPIALWAVEGLSLLFETPTGKVYQDGWKYSAVFPTNKRQLDAFVKYANSTERKEPLRDLLADEEGFKTNEMEGFYATSWALFYYLHKKRPKELAAYIKTVAERPPRSVYSPEERVADFEKHFGNDWEKLTSSLVRFVKKLR